MSELIEVWVTCPDNDIALAIANAAVEARLAACANIVPGITSVYRWEGELVRDREFSVMLKTRATLFDRLAAVIRAEHPYEVPAIIATPVVAVTADYRDWVLAETLSA